MIGLRLQRGFVVVAFAGILFGLLIWLRSAEDIKLTRPVLHLASPATEDAATLRTELARCDALGLKDADDSRCRAVWAENRRRFFDRSGPGNAAP